MSATLSSTPATMGYRQSRPSAARTDMLMWKPLPGASARGLGEKSAYRPLRWAINFTMDWKVITLSAAVRGSE